MELYKKWRPKTLKDVIGQDHITDALSHMIHHAEVPHFMLFSGPPGVGKTSTGRILAERLNCIGQDFQEINCADETGIDGVRSIGLQMQTRSLVKGGNKMFLMDEVHMLSSNAQSGLLKMTEDTPPHVFMIFATTHPNKLLPTLQNRATHFVFKSVPGGLIQKVVCDIAVAENISLTTPVVESIVENSKGSMRAALVLLEQIAGIKGSKEQLNALVAAGSDSEREGIEIARLLYKGGSGWKPIADTIRGCSLEPETIRRIVLSYATSILQNGKFDQRALFMIEAFQYNFYDSGKAGLLLACAKLIK